MGGFNLQKSDIDLIVILEKDISDIQKMTFLEQMAALNDKAPEKGLEISIVKREYCKPFVYPTPFELHFSPMHLQWFDEDQESYVAHMKGEDKDLAAHFMIINQHGITLYGVLSDRQGDKYRRRTSAGICESDAGFDCRRQSMKAALHS